MPQILHSIVILAILPQGQFAVLQSEQQENCEFLTLGVCCRWRNLIISGVFLRIESECVRSTPTLMCTSHKVQKFTALYLSGHCTIWGIRGTKEKHISTFQTFTAFPLGLFFMWYLKAMEHSSLWLNHFCYSLAKHAQSLFCCFCCSGFFVIS